MTSCSPRITRFVRWSDERVVRDLAAAGRGAIFATWHLGPIFPVLANSVPAGAFAAMIQGSGRVRKARHVELILTGDASAAAMATTAFHRALEVVRSGRIVIIAVDGLGSNAPAVECLGRPMVFRRGFAALARMSRAPVYPVAMIWTAGPRPVTLVVGDALPQPSGGSTEAIERSMAEALARWLEAFLLRTPACLPQLFASRDLDERRRPGESSAETGE